jgi:gluconolactonase
MASGVDDMSSRAAEGSPSCEIWDSRLSGLVIPGARLERLWTGGEWLEGPVYVPGDNCVLWSDIPNNRVLRWDAGTREVTVDREPASFANGHTLDLEGRVLTCEHGERPDQPHRA